MSKNEVINITLKANMDIGDIKSKTSTIQGTLSKLKLDDSMSGKFDKLFSGLDTELSKVQEKMNSAFKTKSDVTGFEKSVNKVASMFMELNQEISKIGDKDLRNSLTLDTTEIQRAKERVSELQKEISKKIDTSGFKEVEKAINDMASKSKFKTDFGTAFKLGDIEGAKTALAGLLQNLKTFTSTSDEMKVKIGTIFDDLINGDSQKAEQVFADLREEIDKLDGADGLKSTAANMEILFSKFNELKKVDLNTLRVELEKAGIEVQNLSNAQLDKLAQEIKDAAAQSIGLEQGLRQSGNAAVAAADDMYSLNNQVSQIKNRVQDFFSLTNSVLLFRRAIQSAFDSVKELDAAMTETAVVTDFSVGDMWDKLPEYTKMAKELGATTLGAYETMTLFYQQGLENDQVMQVGTETMKMAHIAGLEYADATDLMTAALRGFNMEVNAANATRINDVYSELAAITAADTNEIATAMTKTASIAASANMEFETTAAFLSQIIETTREPAETAGTAMKTIIARFTEMKKATSDIINVDGEEVSVNKVEAALKSAGVQLRDTSGEFRDLDDVFLELAQNWDHLDLMTQRYIATTAAGSRQQSRFIAMMSNYDRTMELVDAAYDSSGASAAQFAKTQDSLEAKLNKLKDTWQEFTLGLANNEAIKAVVDVLTKLLDTINKATDGIGGFSTLISRAFVIMGGLKLGKSIFDNMFSGVASRFMGEGRKGAEAFNKGLTDGMKFTGKNALQKAGIGAKDFGKKLTSRKDYKKINKETFQKANEADIDVDASSWVQNMKSGLSPEQFSKEMPRIAKTMEGSLATALNTNNLSEEGQAWADGLIDAFVQRMQSGDVEGAVEELENKLAADLSSDDATKYFGDKNEDEASKKKKLDQAKNNLNVQTPTGKTTKPGVTTKGKPKASLNIDEDTAKNAGKIKASVDEIGMGLAAAGMAGNLLASSLEESGAMSKEAADMVKTLSSGLSTTGSMLSMVTTVQKAFNLTAASNVYLAAAAIIIGAITTIASLIGQAAEKQKEFNEEAVNTAKEYNDEVNAVNEQVKAYEELYKVYKENGEETEELKTSKEELIESLELEKYGVNALTSSYEEVAEAAKQARMEMLETNQAKQTAGLQGATANAVTEGAAAAYEGTGWTGGGTGFKINLGAGDNYTVLSSLIEEIAKSEGVTGLSMKQNTWGNMEISGLENSPEAQRIWMKIISQVMSKYQKDHSDSTGYGALMEYWGKVSSYYDSAEEIFTQQKENQTNVAMITAEDYWQTQKEQDIASFSSFSKAVDDIVSKIEGTEGLEDFDKEKAQGIAIDTLLADDQSLNEYSKAYTQILKLANKEGYEEFVDSISDQEIRIIANAEVIIDKDSVVSEIQNAIEITATYDSIWGTAERSKSVGTYANKLASGEEITEEDKQQISQVIQKDFSPVEQEQWNRVQEGTRYQQLEFLQGLAEKSQQKVEDATKAFEDEFDAQVTEDYTYFAEEVKDGKSQYELDQGVVTEGKELVEDIKKADYNYSEDLLNRVDAYETGQGGKYGEASVREHLTAATTEHKNSQNSYLIHDKNTIDTLISQREQLQADLDDINTKDATGQNLQTEGEKLIEEASQYEKEGRPVKAFFSAAKGVIKGFGGKVVEEVDDATDWVAKKIQIPGGEAGGISGGTAEQLTKDSIEKKDTLIQQYTDENKEAQTQASANAEKQRDSGIWDIEHFYEDEANRILDHENTLGHVFYQAGLNPEEINQDRTGDGNVNIDDITDLTSELNQAFSMLNTNEGEAGYGVDMKQAFVNGQLNTSFEGEVDDTTKDWITKVQELEKKGIHIEAEVNDDGTINKATIKLDKFDEKGQKIEDDPIEIQVDGTQLNALAEDIESLDGSLITLNAEVKQANLDATIASFDVATAQAQHFASALGLINPDLTVSPENIEKLKETFPELLQGAKHLGNGILKLDETIYNAFKTEAVDNLKQKTEDYGDAVDGTASTLTNNALAFKVAYDNMGKAVEDQKTVDADATKEFINHVLEKERAAAAQADTQTKLANVGIDTAAAVALAQTTSLSEINTAVIDGTKNWVTYYKAAAGEEVDTSTMPTINISSGSSEAYNDFIDNTTWIDAEELFNYMTAADQDSYTFVDMNGDGSTDDEKAAYDQLLGIVNDSANEETTLSEQDKYEMSEALSQSVLDSIYKGPSYNPNGSGGGTTSGDKEENNTNPQLSNIDTKLEAVERQLENREINAVEHQLAKDKLLLQKQESLQKQLKDMTAEAEYLGKYYKYDEESDSYLYLEDAYNKQSDEVKNKIDEEIQKIQETNTQLNEVEDAIRDLEFKDIRYEEQYYLGYAGETNARTDLEYLDRQRNENDKYKELVGKLPEEVQGPLNLGLLGMDLVYEAQEVGINQGLKADLEEQMRAKYSDSEYAGTGEGKYYDWDSVTQSFKLDEEAISDPELRKETRDKILDEFNQMQDFAKKWKEVSDELSGGIITKGMTSAGKALKAFANEVQDSDFDDDYLKIETGFKALDDALNNLADKLEDSELAKEILNKTIIPKMSDEQWQAILDNEKIVSFLEKSGLGVPVSELGYGDGLSIGELTSFGAGALGSMLESAGGFLNFDMLGTGLELFNGAKGMFEQVSSKIEELVGYITQATQVIIDAWTNREDYLYNFLKIIEKHLQEYEKLQREDNQFQKGRTASVEDIKRNWNEQWKSLQTQLEEQQERLETRQDELNRSRWNPFQLISGWDPTSDTLYENREVKFLWDVIIGLGEAFAPFGTGAFFSQMNQLYEDYDERVQNSYEDRLAAEQAILDIEDQRLELVKAGAEEATQFEEKVLEALIQKEQEQIDELTRLNESITEANSKLISTLQNNLEKIRQDRENEKKEEELGEKERRLAYLRQDTSGANMMEIKKLEEELEEGHEDYTDTLIDQKISELQEQNDKAAEQRQQQIELLQAQLDWNEKYGLYWDTIYGMLYTFDENGNVILKPENFDVDGNIRENSELAKILGTFSDRMGMSTWSAVLDSEELKLLGRYYGAFVGVNGVDGNWKNRWALDDPGADDPNYAYPEQEIPEGVWGVLYSMEIMFKKYFVNSNLGIANGIGRVDEAFKNAFGKLFGNEELANYNFEGYKAEQVQSTLFAGMKKTSDDIAEWFAKTFSKNTENAKNVSVNAGGNQNYGDTNINNTFTIGTVGENISLDDMVDKVSNAIKGMFTSPVNSLQRSR